MATRMLIDARHPEETRVAVLKGNRIEEFDFESADRKQIKGNIYLAKVTRVEPSLQAAFVDFGGNRHGFLAFSEIHPDYYQIPKEDREALLAEEAAHAEEEAALRASEADDEDDVNGDGDNDEFGDDGGLTEVDTSEKDEVSTIEAGHVENGDDEETSDDVTPEADAEEGRRRRGRGRRNGKGSARSKEADELRAKRMALRRRYKIQDVIHRRQVLLVQVVKEERGNKGAALTTYLSLAGRYCVLMPNSSHGGGISRKISSTADRKRLKSIIAELNLPRSMGCIVRTAGLQRTKTEIKRDFDYLARLWDELREKTLGSSAPSLIHSDSDLIKRAIRDIYNRDIEEVVVEGEEGYRAAKDFMKLLMPSHARKVKPYSDPVPLFQRFGAEDQLTAMYDPVVQLKSGGYIVINPTEALVSIDINSGRATKEHGIEQTALATNLEAAHEIARQLRLRDMAGLVVIDFIDMEYGSSIRKVEKAMKEALKNDRARIQVGRISSFGLMEMSRQRLRTGVLEATTRSCPHCDGTGLVRTASSAGLSALRLIEDEAAKGKGVVVSLFASTEAAIYLLNAKRADLADIEMRYGVNVEVIPEGENEGAKMRVVSSGPRNDFVPRFEPIAEDVVDDDYPDDEDEEFEREEAEARAENGEGESRGRKRRKRRRGRNRDRREDQEQSEGGAEAANDDEPTDADEAEGAEPVAEDGEAPRKRRRRGGRRRRGRRNGENGVEGLTESGEDEADEGEGDDVAAAAEAAAPDDASATEAEAVPAVVEEAAPAPKKRTRRKKVEPVEAEVTEVTEAAAEATAGEAAADEAAAEEAPAKPKRTRRKKADDAETAPAAESAVAEEAPAKPKRTRRKKADEADATVTAPESEEAPAKPKRTRRKKVEAAEAEVPEAGATEPSPEEPKSVPVETSDAAPTDSNVTAMTASDEAQDNADSGPPRRGWWQRTFGNE